MEREENGILANISGLTRSYSASNEELAKAQGRLQALTNSASEGKTVIRAKDDPTLAALEQRIATLREELGDLQRRFTPQYLALDADVTAKQARLVDLEQQLKTRHTASEQTAIDEAQEQLSASQAAVNRLRKDLNDNQRLARDFAAHLAEYKVQQEDLDHLQSMERAVLDRLAKLRASERERAPRVELVEAAAPSLQPWRPDYDQNALISLAGSLALGLFAVWLAEYLRGPAPAHATMVHHSIAPSYSLATSSVERFPASPLRSLSVPDLTQVPTLEPFPRELDNAEIAALVSDTTDDLCLVSVALLIGLSAAEIIALRWDHIDFHSGTIKVDGEAARVFRLVEPVATLLSQRRENATTPTVLHDDLGGPIDVDVLRRLILYGAYDSGIDRPQDVTPSALRHTYLAFLLRQGLRATDLSRIAGYIPQEDLVAYMQLSSPRTRLPLEQVDCIHPVLRGLLGGVAHAGTLN